MDALLLFKNQKKKKKKREIEYIGIYIFVLY